MEGSLGLRLLDRGAGIGGGTAAGATLLVAAGSALALREEACADICDTARRLTVSANVSLSTMWLARGPADFSALHPDVANAPSVGGRNARSVIEWQRKVATALGL